MSTEMKTGLVLSGGGAVGAYQAGVVKALAECGTQISMVSGASIGAFNGAIIAASPDLSEAAVRLEALWDHLGNNQVLSVNRLVYFSLLKKLFQAMNLCQIPGRAGALLTTLLRHISILNGFDNLMAQPLLSDEPLTALLDHYLDTDALADGLPLYVSLYPTEGGMQDIISRACPADSRKRLCLRQPRCPCCSVPVRFRGQCSVMVVWEDGEICREIPQ